MDPSDYTGTELPFHLTSLVGIKVFNIDSTRGGLTGPVYDEEIWTDGVNQAVCHRHTGNWDYETETYKPFPPHKVGALSCKCGFYAFQDDSNIEYYHESTRYKWRGMLGLIEGWGRVTFGTRGFRCSHARILALVEPVNISRPKDRPCEPVDGECAHEAWPLVRHNYASIPYYHTLLEALMDFPLRGIDDRERAS